MEFAHLERLTAVECRRLLPGAPVGRLVLPTPNFPTVEPVAFAVVEDGVAVVVRAGSAGDAAADGTPVAFEADVLDTDLHQGWSVVVKGPLEPLDGEAIVFRTQVGTKLAGIARSLATFEVDHIDADGQGWAVSFEGLAQELLDADPAALRARVDALPLDTWPGGDRPHVVRITAFAVRGTAWTPAGIASAAGATGRSAG